MRKYVIQFYEIKSIPLLLPERQTIKSLQTQKQNITKQLNAERDRQKKQYAQQQLLKAQQAIKAVVWFKRADYQNEMLVIYLKCRLQWKT